MINNTMRTTFFIFFALTIVSCSTSLAQQYDKQSYADSLKKIAIAQEKAPLLQPIPEAILVSLSANDTDVVVFKKKCAVFAAYSESELAEMEKESKAADEWEAFYDDYSYYANEASQFLDKKTTIQTEPNKKYIQFLLASGEKITVDRYKSVGMIFFFNPKTGVKQCMTTSFEKEKYVGF
jgi:hypothetical protein